MEVDFNYKHSLVVAMLGVKCVFLHTVYWENYSCTLEVMHVTILFSAPVSVRMSVSLFLYV